MDSQRENVQTLDLDIVKDALHLETLGLGSVVEDSTRRPSCDLSQTEVQVRVLRKPRENKWRRYAEEVARYHLMGPC